MITHEIFLWVLIHCRLLVHWANDAFRQQNSGKAQLEFHSGFSQVRRSKYFPHWCICVFPLQKANVRLCSRLVAVQLMFNLKAINLQTVRHHELPDCYDFTLTVRGSLPCIFQFEMRIHSCWFTIHSQHRYFWAVLGTIQWSPPVSGLLCLELVPCKPPSGVIVKLWVLLMQSSHTCSVFCFLYSNPSEVWGKHKSLLFREVLLGMWMIFFFLFWK